MADDTILDVKLIIIGDEDVGKSSLMVRYVDDQFEKSFNGPLGVEYKIKQLEIPYNEKIYKVRLKIWDTFGQEKFRTLTSSFYRNSNGVFVVYDISDPKSFENVELWLREMERYIHYPRPVFIIGNKTDLTDDRQISQVHGKILADNLGAKFYEVSAKNNENVSLIFEKMAKAILKRMLALDKEFKSSLNEVKIVENKRCNPRCSI